ncbi:hypothetical protein AL469_014610 [Vibrio harveyi]|nr:hypothetical protein AL469_014610 [Vibrio harveyi]
MGTLFSRFYSNSSYFDKTGYRNNSKPLVGNNNITNCLRGIHHAWHFHHALLTLTERYTLN